MTNPEGNPPPQRPAVFPVSLGWLAHAVFWLSLCAVALAGAWLVERSLYFDGIPPVPLRANPRILSISIFGIPVALLALWLLNRTLGRRSIPIVATGSLLVAMCLVGIIASVWPGPGSLASREIVQVSSLTPRQNTFAFPVYFENDEFELPKGEVKRIVDALSVFRVCEAGTLRVRGFASSAEYRPDRGKSDEYNKNLSNRRAAFVSALLKKHADVDASVKEWATYKEMTDERRLRDIGLDGERLLKIERLNRRVEVFWSDSRCSDGERIGDWPIRPS
jgi:hypothetical protein